MAVIVEERDAVSVVVHGTLAGLVAGLVLGVTTIIGSVVLTGDASRPFRFAAAFMVGPQTLDADFPLGPALLLGTTIHLALAATFGILFVGLLALTGQLSARPLLLLLYGSAFGFGLWEVNFLVVVPTFFPFLMDRVDLATQFWNGILSYVLIYGPLLGAYVIVVRPGVIDDWHAVGPPAGTFAPPDAEEPG